MARACLVGQVVGKRPGPEFVDEECPAAKKSAPDSMVPLAADGAAASVPAATPFGETARSIGGDAFEAPPELDDSFFDECRFDAGRDDADEDAFGFGGDLGESAYYSQ